MSDTSQILQKACRCSFEPSATTTTRRACCTMIRLISASPSLFAAAPPVGLSASTPRNIMSMVRSLQAPAGKWPDEFVGLVAGHPTRHDDLDMRSDR